MSVPIIAEVCYTCQSCLVSKKVCNLKRSEIMNIYRDKCDNYIQRRMYRCLFCGDYVINLPQHVALDHKKTMSAYRVETKNIDPRFTSVRRKNLWE